MKNSSLRNHEQLILLVGSWEEQRAIIERGRLPDNYLQTYLRTYKSQPQAKEMFTALIKNPFLSRAVIEQLALDNQEHHFLRWEDPINYLYYHPYHPEFKTNFLSTIHERCLVPVTSQLAGANLGFVEKLIREQAILSGSFLAEVLTGARQSSKGIAAQDYDFYLNEAGALALFQEFKQIQWEEEHTIEMISTETGFCDQNLTTYGSLAGNWNGIKVLLTNNALSLELKHCPRLQLIFKFSRQDFTITRSTFDFAHCRLSLNLSTGELWLPTEGTEFSALLNRVLYYHNSPRPLAALIRGMKFFKRGWTFPQTQLLKIILDLQTINFQDPTALKKNWESFYTAHHFPEILSLPEDRPLSPTELLNLLESLTTALPSGTL